MKRLVIAFTILGFTSACGGKQTQTEEAEASADGTVATESTNPPDISDEGMIPPEKMEEIHRLLERRRPAVSRCLSVAVDAKELPKSARGKVTLAIVVGTNGRADSVKIIKSNLDSKVLTDCVVEKVHEIPYPTIPKTYETTYSYGFEAT